ncbi:MAG: pyridoxal phosphate-dependent aminotransferase [Candidatus Brocadia sp. AMX2]|uniref:Aminotransferase n=1 Tax=Candidatus Brocadia sinica JPN1 TaxID=1197129 RepID=A0ABQ0JW67_9BACT|nr:MULTISPECIES: pyridoxal phosphate-dependent aminotransferase [Brocadia]KXK29742.1 MAG: aminotransferase [Candidatus Brocadia sinica]MBC6931835.1 pyridoxal phosphate-dependent aminotransferase [Candidatus Brocadia sp.]MBL1167310.1 pyridoxal phosphate-dependent aminotransferase [Candidatus Brocadia sp. AMX1]NOG41217.1 pyridoxal phosphate-dependent aminotransferase [Planctomycetota bacterium]KAA0245717.1 MAG: pyridoxal phosphate-dependent aminotransferase [Candidatus Brocadia sp. AMX2]
MALSRIAREVKTSATLAITAKAKQLAVKGIDVVGFGAGEPDFDTPENVKNAAIKAIKDGYTKYTPTAGAPVLKEAICEKLFKENHLKYNPSQIIVSAGAKQAILNIVLVLCDTGDEAIIPTPYWVSYPEMVVMAGATPVFLKTTDKEHFKITKESLARAITPRSKLLFMNSPSNPTGMVYTKEELQEIVSFAVEKGLYVISDEIYEKILYDGAKHFSPASFHEECYKKVVTINGFSKVYSMTGWRLGYAAGPEEIIKAATNIQDHTTSGANSITQLAGVEALKGSQDSVGMMVREFDRRRKYTVERLNAIKGVSCLLPQGAFYAFPNVSDLYKKKIGGQSVTNSFDLVNLLLEKAHVAFVPGAPFGSDEYIRISYATSMGNIEKGIDRFEKFLGS